MYTLVNSGNSFPYPQCGQITRKTSPVRSTVALSVGLAAISASNTSVKIAWPDTAVRHLEKAMLDYLDRRNRKPKPFVWTADADLILGKVQRICKRISNSGH
jgi:hypothetical protein